MRVQAMIVLLSLVSMVGYSIWSVHHRNDRRKVPVHMSQALHGVSLFAFSVIGSATLMDLASSNRLLAVKEVFEIGVIGSCVAVVIALRILKGAPYDRR